MAPALWLGRRAGDIPVETTHECAMRKSESIDERSIENLKEADALVPVMAAMGPGHFCGRVNETLMSPRVQFRPRARRRAVGIGQGRACRGRSLVVVLSGSTLHLTAVDMSRKRALPPHQCSRRDSGPCHSRNIERCNSRCRIPY